MTEKKRKTAPAATATTTEQPAVEIADPEVTVEQPAPAFDRAEIMKAFDKNPLLKGFKSYLNPVLDYMESVEARLQAADQNFQKIGVFLDRMEPLVKLGEQFQQRQTQQQTTAAPPAQGGFMGLPPEVMQLGVEIGKALSGSGGGDSDFAELGKKALLSQISMSNAITNAVVAKITGKATTEVAEAVTGG